MWESNKEQEVEQDNFIRWKGDNEKEVFYFLEGHNNISTEGKNFYIDFEGVSTCHVGNLILKNGNKKVDVGSYIVKGNNGFYVLDVEYLEMILKLDFFETRQDIMDIINDILFDYCDVDELTFCLKYKK